MNLDYLDNLKIEEVCTEMMGNLPTWRETRKPLLCDDMCKGLYFNCEDCHLREGGGRWRIK